MCAHANADDSLRLTRTLLSRTEPLSGLWCALGSRTRKETSKCSSRSFTLALSSHIDAMHARALFLSTAFLLHNSTALYAIIRSRSSQCTSKSPFKAEPWISAFVLFFANMRLSPNSIFFFFLFFVFPKHPHLRCSSDRLTQTARVYNARKIVTASF